MTKTAVCKCCVKGIAACAKRTANLSIGVVNKPFINAEENIVRVVGRRTKTPDAWEAGMQLQELALQMHRSLKHRWCPKGVYRFKSHEEADEWMNRMLARSQMPKS
jgi:hypothetical protein